MASTQALVVGGGSPLDEELERRRSEAREMEIQVTRKEGELRRAKEEEALLKELRVINEMIIRKKEHKASSTEETGKLKISPESLAELMALENEIKSENDKTARLQDEAGTTLRQLEDVEKALTTKNRQLSVVKSQTGWERGAHVASAGNAVENEFVARKKVLTSLAEEQQNLKTHTDRLTTEIEALASQLKKQEELDRQTDEAHELLQKHSAEYANLQEEIKSMERLSKKKERLLDSVQDSNDNEYNVVRQLEGDKKVLYNNMVKLRETKMSNSKSILALEVRLRQLETKLEAVNLFAKSIFEGDTKEAMDNIPEDAYEVPLAQFEELGREVELSRQSVKQRDDQLKAHDAKVEQLERKLCILQNAVASRAVSSQLQVREKEKEFDALMSHVDFMKSEFEDEYTRLTSENELLRRKLAAV